MSARRRQQHESDEPSAASTPKGGKTRYKMQTDLFTIGDDFWIEDSHGKNAFKVDGKIARVRDTLIFEDADGSPQAQIQKRVARVRDTMEIEDENGKRAAVVKKAFITPVRERFTVSLHDGPELEVKGDVLDHEYTIGDVAEVSQRWWRLQDTYGVEIQPGQDDVVILAVAVVIERMERREEEN